MDNQNKTEASELPPLPDALEIDWPQLNSSALGCGVEDRSLHDRYEAAEYGWQDGVDRAAERVPDDIYDADQMQDYARAAIAMHRAAAAKPDVCAQMRALCSACGGTGDVTRVDGEYLGKCDCEASQAAAEPVPTDLSNQLREIASRPQLDSCMSKTLLADREVIRAAANEIDRLAATKPAPTVQASEAVGMPVAIGCIMTGDIEYGSDGAEMGDWDVEWDHKLIDSLPEFRYPNKAYSVYLATPAAPTDAIPELRNAFMTLESSGGEGRTIVLKFNQSSDAYAVHDFLLKGGTKDYAGAPTDAGVRDKAQAVIDAALEGAMGRVHVCDRGNNDLKALTLSEEMQALYEALKSSPQAPKQEGSA